VRVIGATSLDWPGANEEARRAGLREFTLVLDGQELSAWGSLDKVAKWGTCEVRGLFSVLLLGTLTETEAIYRLRSIGVQVVPACPNSDLHWISGTAAQFLSLTTRMDVEKIRSLEICKIIDALRSTLPEALRTVITEDGRVRNATR